MERDSGFNYLPISDDSAPQMKLHVTLYMLTFY
jgi:hypothetical protein